jgi:hypothetical protein
MRECAKSRCDKRRRSCVSLAHFHRNVRNAIGVVPTSSGLIVRDQGSRSSTTLCRASDDRQVVLVGRSFIRRWCVADSFFTSGW